MEGLGWPASCLAMVVVAALALAVVAILGRSR